MRDINYIAQCCDVAKIITAFIYCREIICDKTSSKSKSIRNLYFGEYLQVFSFFIVFSTHFAVFYEDLRQ